MKVISKRVFLFEEARAADVARQIPVGSAQAQTDRHT